MTEIQDGKTDPIIEIHSGISRYSWSGSVFTTVFRHFTFSGKILEKNREKEDNSLRDDFSRAYFYVKS